MKRGRKNYMDNGITAILRACRGAETADGLAVMRLSLLDWMAVGLAGLQEPVSQIMHKFAAQEAGAPHASLFGGGRAPTRMAALVNGTISHALDYDDTHFAHIGHPSVAVIPAALAVAEAQGASLQSFVRAAFLGCEASIRFGLLFGREHYQIGFHQTGTAGAFGAAYATACLLTDDEALHAQVLGLVSTRASGLKSQFGTMGKPYNAGAAASNGVEAALLAELGFVSNPQALSGINGFLQTHHANGSLSAQPGCLMQAVSHKFHACCHGLHAALEALQNLDALDLQSLQSIEVQTHPRWMTVCNQREPITGLGAKFSYNTVIALSLLGHDTAALQTYSDALACDPKVVELRDRVHVFANPALTETQAQLAVHLEAGTLYAEFDLETLQPLSQRQERVRRKAESLIGAQKTEQIWSVIEGHKEAPISDLTRFMA